MTGGDFGRATAVAVASVAAAAVGPSAVGCGMLLSGLVVAADGCGTEWVAAVWSWRPGPREAVDSSSCRASAARWGVCNDFVWCTIEGSDRIPSGKVFLINYTDADLGCVGLDLRGFNSTILLGQYDAT